MAEFLEYLAAGANATFVSIGVILLKAGSMIMLIPLEISKRLAAVKHDIGRIDGGAVNDLVHPAVQEAPRSEDFRDVDLTHSL